MDARLIEIDLSDLGLTAEMRTLDAVAGAAAHVYERFVPYADDGWEWLSYPGSREFDGWVYSVQADRRTLAGVRLACRRVSSADAATISRPAHGVSAYRTRQLTGTPWTAEPGSKVLRR